MDLYTDSRVSFSFRESSVIGMIHNADFKIYFLSFNKTSLTIHLVSEWLNGAFLYNAEMYSIILRYQTVFCLFVLFLIFVFGLSHSPTETCLGYFQIMRIMNKSAINSNMDFVWT